MEYDFIVGFTLFNKTGFKTRFRHFDNLRVAKMFASNVNLKDNSKIYVDLKYMQDKIKAKIEEVQNMKAKAKDIVLKKLHETESDLYEANNRITDLLLILGDRDRMINEMAKYIDDFQMECNKYYKDKEDVIKTFEERCKNAKD